MSGILLQLQAPNDHINDYGRGTGEQTKESHFFFSCTQEQIPHLVCPSCSWPDTERACPTGAPQTSPWPGACINEHGDESHSEITKHGTESRRRRTITPPGDAPVDGAVPPGDGNSTAGGAILGPPTAAPLLLAAALRQPRRRHVAGARRGRGGGDAGERGGGGSPRRRGKRGGRAMRPRRHGESAPGFSPTRPLPFAFLACDRSPFAFCLNG